MQKSRNQIFKTLNISLIFLALGVLVAIFLGSFLISCANPKPTPTPTDTTKITGYNGDIIDNNITIDKENNLFFINNDSNTTNVFKVEHDTTNAIKIISTDKNPSDPNPDFKIKLDLKNNLYIYAPKKYKYYKVEHNTTNPVELKLNGIDNENIAQIWFDKNNNIFISYYKNNIFTFYKVEHNTTNAVEITGITGHLEKFEFDSENNLWIQSGTTNNIKFYEIKHDTTNAVEVTITGITDFNNFSWIIDNNDNLYFVEKIGQTQFGNLYRVNKNTINPIEITGYTHKVYSDLKYKNKGNLYFNDETNNFYQINSNETNATKINENQENIDNVIFDNSNNLWFTSNFGKFIFKVKHDTTNAIKITWKNINTFNFNIDKNNNLYFISLEQKFYMIKNNETNVTPVEIPNHNNGIMVTYFDKNNNLYFIDNNEQLYKTTNFIK